MSYYFWCMFCMRIDFKLIEKTTEAQRKAVANIMPINFLQSLNIIRATIQKNKERETIDSSQNRPPTIRKMQILRIVAGLF